MKYIAYKISFQTGVHFGNGMLNETDNRFLADTLFSALCIEAMKWGKEYLERLYNLVKEDKLLLSDAFPYIKDTLYISKPMISVEHTQENISERKTWKKLKYIPIDKVEDFLLGRMDGSAEKEKLDKLGRTEVREIVSLSNEEKSEPYSIGVYHFEKGNGLYFIVGYEAEKDIEFIENLIDSLGYQGIGGKVSSGLGKYSMLPCELPHEIVQRLEKNSGDFILLTTSLPKNGEMESVLENSNYLLEKRGGFVQSNNYSNELVKKKEQFFLRAGSITHYRFSGDVYNVGGKGTHPVWRYGKPILMEVSN